MHSLARLVALASLLVSATSILHAQIDARMFRYPDVSATSIAFVYAGDVWVVPKEGGTAVRLSTPPGEETFPRFSPDGASIAFTGNYDGNPDIYVMPAKGGIPVRVTHHPAADIVAGWYPDGKSLLFATDRTSGTDRFTQLYKVAANGGLPEKLPVPYGTYGAISPDGRTLAYVTRSRDFVTWKRYRGGDAPDIWLFDLVDHTARNLTNDDANDGMPMWHGKTLYFLSDRDRNKRSNIWACDTTTGKFRQITFFEEYDVHLPAIGPKEIVFENAGRLYLLDLVTEKAHEVKVEVVTDEATLKPRIEKVDKQIHHASISPAGKRAIFGARGEIFSLPAEHGVILNLTRSSGVAERYPSWSPDGKTVAYFTDRSGEYELAIRPADGSGEEKILTHLGPGFRYTPRWSPDGKRVAFIDQAMNIHLCDPATGEGKIVDKSDRMAHEELERFDVSWSADSRWMAYPLDKAGRNTAIVLYDTKKDERHQVTSGFYGETTPVFDPEGKYLYFLSQRTYEPTYGDVDRTWIYANTTNVVAVPLRADVASPLAPRDDQDKGDGAEGKKDGKGGKDGKDGKDGEGKKGAGKTGSKDEAAAKDEGKGGASKESGEDSEKKPKKVEPVEIDLAGFEERLVVLPPAAGNYSDLQAIPGKVLFFTNPRAGSPEKTGKIGWYDLGEREEKTLVGEADGFTVSEDGKKMLVWKGGGTEFFISDVKPDTKLEKKLATSDLEMLVDPPAEWRQIFDDAWRFERDFFYDPHMHGLDWEGMRKRYGALLKDAVTRWDVNYVLGELIGELNCSHTYRGGGDLQDAPKRGVGMLGVDFSLENGAYRIKKIIDGAPWNSEVRSPLRTPGVKVKEGDYLLAVNGAALDTKQDPWAAFQGLAGKTVTLTVNDKPGRDGARDILVETMPGEARLRNLDWIETNRRRVDEATKGRVGYIYVPDTGTEGQTELVRQFHGQYTKDGLIIDERFNSGGQIPDRFVELLNRPRLSYWALRDGTDFPWPPIAHEGPKAMLMNGWSGSGGDCFPLYFKMAGLGPLIGERTWGGLIGISGSPYLVDGGFVTVPAFAIYGTDGKWTVEGHGVDPDIPVVDDPAQMAAGKEPQLDRAIEEVMKQLEKKPPKVPKRPAYVDRSGR